MSSDDNKKAEPTFLGLFEKQRSIIIGIIVATGIFFWQVVIPIREIQVKLVSIESTLSDNKGVYSAIQTKQNELDMRLKTVETILNQHVK